jgi:arylsulfatase
MWPVGYDGKPAPNEHNKAKYPFLPLIDGNDKVAELRTIEDQNMLTTRYTERAVQFIEKNKDRPFFLYVPHSMPHVPLGVSEKFRGKSQQGMYGDVMMEIDWSVGEILKTIERFGLNQNTMVVFTTDNGPWMNFGNHAGSALPLREGKGTSWEGGVRVPCIIRWPGHIPPGIVCDKIATTMDLLPTFAAISEAPLPEHKIDGINILPLLQGKSEANPRNHLFYYYGRQLQCVREGKWKLHFPHSYRSYQGVKPGMDGLNGPYARGETGIELYDLENDLSEKHDVADKYPEVVKRLQALGEKAREELGDGKRIGKGVRPPGRLKNSGQK